MSPDLDPAVEAAAVNAYHARATDGTPGVHHDFLAAAVAAAAPLIRAAERAAVEAERIARRGGRPTMYEDRLAQLARERDEALAEASRARVEERAAVRAELLARRDLYVRTGCRSEVVEVLEEAADLIAPEHTTPPKES